jgi:hypothetical protein
MFRMRWDLDHIATLVLLVTGVAALSYLAYQIIEAGLCRLALA